MIYRISAKAKGEALYNKFIIYFKQYTYLLPLQRNPLRFSLRSVEN